MNYSSYLVCKDKVKEVKIFLSQFFEEIKTKYSHDDWVTFKIPDTNFTVNLMKGSDQEITKNMTFEIGCDSLGKLQSYAEKFGKEIDSFVATETGNDYRYHYIEILGPDNICKIEISYVEDLD